MSPEMEQAIERKLRDEFRNFSFDRYLNNSCVDYANLPWFIRSTARGIDQIESNHFARNPIVIGMCGNMGTGKDSALNFFLRYPELRCVRVAFADPIREIGQIFGFTLDQMTNRTFKEQMDDFWKVSPRWFMQRVGTEMFRKQWREDVWIELMHRRLNQLMLPITDENGKIVTRRIIFISDVRFPNEADFIHSIGGLIVKVQRDGFSKKGEDLHDSERFIESIKADYTIRNDRPDANRWSWYFSEQLVKFLSGKNPYNGMQDRGKIEEN